MVKSSELRIGNCIIYGGFEIALTANTFVRILNGGIDRMSIEGIPIIPKIFEKFTFDRITETFDDGKDVIIRLFKEIDNYTELNFYPDKIIIVQKPRSSVYTMADISFVHLPMPMFVHQLQNLYHSLTGQELEIKELAHA